MFFGPAAKRAQRFDQRPTQFGKRILDFRWNDWINPALDQTVPFQAAKSLRQHFLGNPTDLAVELGVTQCPLREQLDDNAVHLSAIRSRTRRDGHWASKTEAGDDLDMSPFRGSRSQAQGESNIP